MLSKRFKATNYFVKHAEDDTDVLKVETALGESCNHACS